MQIVIYREAIIVMFALSWYSIFGGDYDDIKETVTELVDKINYTILPEGHGRLGDLDKIKKEMQNYYDDCAKTSEYTRLGLETAIAVVEDADTIIEADSAEGEDEDKE